MTKHRYKAPDGTIYPLKEAQYDMDFTIYGSHRKKAVKGDPEHCLLALGVLRNRLVKDVYIGSGIDAYVVFEATDTEEATAVHFTINRAAKRAVDAFDKNRKAQTMKITLKAPAKSHRLAYRRQSNSKRAAEVRAGATRKKTGKPRATRISRLGVAPRPKPTVIGGTVV